MFILAIIIIILLGYILYLRNKANQLKRLQIMIALLQEQTQFLGDIPRVKSILKKEGIKTIRLNEAYRTLSKAYFDGFYNIFTTEPYGRLVTKEQLSEIRKKAEKILFWKISIKDLHRMNGKTKDYGKPKEIF